MVLFLKLMILTMLGVFAAQDFKERAVFWFLPPLLAIAFAGLAYSRLRDWGGYWLPVFFNLEFIALVLLMTTAYCSIRKRRFVNIIRFLGLGDILFLAAIAFYLSELNFAFFFVASSIMVLFCWRLWRWATGRVALFIPLGGFYAVFLLLMLSCDWFLFHFNVTNNFWLWRLMFY